MSQATFTEVLELQIALDKFSQQMDEVARIYKEKLGDLPSPLEASSNTAAINNLTSTIEDMGKHILDVFDTITKAQIESVDSIAAAQEKSVEGAESAAQAKLTIEEKWNLRRSAIQQKQEEEEDAARAKGEIAYQKYLDTKLAEEEKWNIQRSTMQQKQEDKDAAQFAKSDAAFQKYLDDKFAQEEKWNILRSTMQQKQEQQDAAQFAKSEAAHQKYLDDLQKQEERWVQIRAAMQQKSARDEQRINEQSAKAYAQYKDSQQKLAGQVPAANLPSDFFNNQPLEKMQQTIKNIKQELSDQAPARDGFFGQMTRDLPDLISNVIRFATAWKLVGGIINLVLEIPERLFAEIKNGLTYLDQLQEKTADMQGVIAANVTLSKDWTENFKLAGDAAGEIQKKLEDIAITSALNADALEKAFKATLESGGGAFVQNLDDAVKLTQLFGLAMKAAGKDAESTRSLISEIPKLLDGTVSKSSKLLEVLHLTKSEWEQIRQSSLANRDLVSQLAPLMQPYLSVVDQAAVRQSVLTEQLSLMKDRVEASISQPLWEAWQKVLEDAKGTLQDSEGSIVGMGRSLADTLVTTIDLAKELGSLKYIVVLLAQALNFVNYSVRTIVGSFQAIADITDALVRSGPGLSGLKKSSQDIKSILDKAGEKFADDLDRASATAQDIAEGTNKRDEFEKYVKTRETNKTLVPAQAYGAQPATQGIYDVKKFLGDNATKLQILGNSNPTDKSNGTTSNKLLRAVLDDFKEDAQKIEDAQELLRENTDNFIKKRKVSVADGEKQIADSYLNEGAQLLTLIDKIKKFDIPKLKAQGVPQADIDHLTSTLDRQAEAARKKAVKGIDDSDTKSEEDRIKQLQKLSDQKVKIATLEAQSETEVLDSAHRESLTNDVAFAQQSLAVLDKRHQAIMAALQEEKKADGENAQARQATQAKIDAEDERYTADRIKRSEDVAKAERDEADAVLRIAQADRQRQLRTQSNNTQARAQAGLDSPGVTYGKELQDAEDALKNAAQTQLEALQKYNKRIMEGADPASKELRQLAEDAKNSGAAYKDAGNQVMVLIAQNPFGRLGLAIKQFVDILNDKNASGLDKFNAALNAASVGLNSIQNLVQQFSSGNIGGGLQSTGGLIGSMKDGGALGGIGKLFGSAVQGALPVVGGIISAIGSVFSIFGGMFTAAAKKIAANIKKDIDGIMTLYNGGQQSLVSTINQLEAKRQQAISQLSGKKGGKDELDKLLPDLDDQINQLKKQQKETLDNFDQQLNALRLGSDVLADWYNSWVAINKQVKDYIDAGGDANKANELLRISLANEQKKLNDDLSSGEKDAIEQAIQLNDLLDQRNDLEKQFKEQEFDIITAGDEERRGASAIVQGRQLAQARDDNAKQLKDLDDQIDLLTKQVDIQKQVFDISSNIEDLHRKDEELTLDALQEQVDQYKDMLKLIDQISAISPAQFNNPNAFGPQGAALTVGTLQVNLTGDPSSFTKDNANEIADSIYDSLNERYRSGRSQ